MEITIKKTTEESIHVNVPSYLKNEDRIISVISESRCVVVSPNHGAIMTGSPKNWIDTSYGECSRVEFMKAYNKAHEAIEELILSVEEVAK